MLEKLKLILYEYKYFKDNKNLNKIFKNLNLKPFLLEILTNN
jgi:hypothetical protein